MCLTVMYRCMFAVYRTRKQQQQQQQHEASVHNGACTARRAGSQRCSAQTQGQYLYDITTTIIDLRSSVRSYPL